MDPTKNLAELRKMYARLITMMDDDVPSVPLYVISEISYDLAAHIEALDEWISRGGHLPAQWTSKGHIVE